MAWSLAASLGIPSIPDFIDRVSEDITRTGSEVSEFFQEDIEREIGTGIRKAGESLFGKDDSKKEEVPGELKLPSRDEVISSILKQQVETLRRRRLSSTTKTSARGVLEGAPTAMSTLFGV